MFNPVIKPQNTFAAPTVTNVCSHTLGVGEVPDIFQLICPIVAFFNVFLISAGAAFIVVGLYAAIKMAMAQGDPKALATGRSTLWMAFVAFIGFVFIGTFFSILNNTLGLNVRILEEPIGPFNMVVNELFNLLCLQHGSGNGTIISGNACGY